MDIAVHHQLYLQTFSRAVTFGFALHQEDHSDSGAAPQVMSRVFFPLQCHVSSGRGVWGLQRHREGRVPPAGRERLQAGRALQRWSCCSSHSCITAWRYSMNTAWVTLFRAWIMYFLLLIWFAVPAASFPFQTCVFLPPADHMALSCDVSKEQEVQKTFETIQRNCGNITYLVNSAGINRCVFFMCWHDCIVSGSLGSTNAVTIRL